MSGKYLIKNYKREKCKKATFPNVESANERAKQINEKNIGNNDSTRLRPYKCEKCSEYHLSSMDLSKHKEIKKDKNKNKEKKRNRFLAMERDYWNKKFGL
jgi:hypothetical protein